MKVYTYKEKGNKTRKHKSRSSTSLTTKLRMGMRHIDGNIWAYGNQMKHHNKYGTTTKQTRTKTRHNIRRPKLSSHRKIF